MEQQKEAQWLANFYLEHHAQRFWNEVNTGDLSLEQVPLNDLILEAARNLHPTVFQQCDFENNAVPSFVLLGFEQVLFMRVKEWFEMSQKDTSGNF
jgi:hypothetical protein